MDLVFWKTQNKYNFFVERPGWLPAVGEALQLAPGSERARVKRQQLDRAASLLQHNLDLGEEVGLQSDKLDQLAGGCRLADQAARLDCLLDRMVELGLLPSPLRHQTPNWYEPGLAARPVWRLVQLGSPLEEQLTGLAADWRELRAEAELLVRDHNWTTSPGWTSGETELDQDGGWHQLVFSGLGNPPPPPVISKAAPCLTALPDQLQSHRQTFGQIKLSVMVGPMRVAAHSGYTNTRLRVHLPLVVPADPPPRLRLVDQNLTWTEGELLVFDDSFEHEVWHESSQARIVLILDMNHPDLLPARKQWYEENVIVAGWTVAGAQFKIRNKL